MVKLYLPTSGILNPEELVLCIHQVEPDSRILAANEVLVEQWPKDRRITLQQVPESSAIASRGARHVVYRKGELSSPVIDREWPHLIALPGGNAPFKI